jgi:hypothetical protein
VLVRTGVTSNKDPWLCVLNIPVGSQRDILACRNLNIQIPGGQEDPVISEITTFISYRGKTKDSCDLNSAWID